MKKQSRKFSNRKRKRQGGGGGKRSWEGAKNWMRKLKLGTERVKQEEEEEEERVPLKLHVGSSSEYSRVGAWGKKSAGEKGRGKFNLPKKAPP